MTLFFDTKVQFLDSEAVSTISVWHNVESVFAVASYSQNRGGSVTIFDEQGEPLRDVTYPVHAISQATALCWHPEKTLLVTGWENGEIFAWFKGRREFYAVKGLHKAPIVCLGFSEQGGRLVSADAMGVLIGWRDSQNQFLTVFTHELKEPIIHVTFRRTLKAENAELANLAKAAVAGDESALDTLTNWRPKTAARNNTQFMGVKDNHCFYVGSQNGVLYYVNQQGTCTEVMHLASAPIIQLLWHPQKDAVVAMLDDMTVVHFFVESSGVLAELDRVKLSGRIPGHNGFMAWTYGNALAIIVGDLSVRIWDIETSDNYLLPLEVATKKGQQKTSHVGGVEIFTCLGYSNISHTICAGTSHGNLFSWHRTARHAEENVDSSSVDSAGRSAGHWQLNNVSNVRGAIKQCGWGLCDVVTPCILLNCITNVYVMKEQPLIIFHGPEVTALQRTAHSIYLEYRVLMSGEKDRRCTVSSEVPVTDLAANSKFLVLTNGRKIVAYQLVLSEEPVGERLTRSTKEKGEATTVTQTLNVKQVNSFTSSNQKLLLHDDKIIISDGENVRIMSISGGVVLQELNFKSREGNPIGMDLNQSYLTVFTMNGFVRLYDVSKHEPKLITPPSGTMRTGYDLFDDFGEFISIKSSASGTHLCMLIATANLLPDGKLYVWNVEMDQVTYHDFFAATSHTEKFFTKLPVNFYWDRFDSRLLAVEVKCIQQKAVKGGSDNISSVGRVVTESMIFVMFLSEKGRINELEVISLGPSELMVDLCVPHVVTLKINEIGRIALRDFKGLENCNSQTRQMVLDFSLNVAQGNMDQAFKSIRSIQSDAVWENLAKMCVQTRRLDVAKVCLGHLKRSASARALRLAMQDSSLEEEAKVAVLAIELKMIDKAEELYKICGRYDLLNKLHQDSGKFEEAIKVAEKFDRVHLKNTYYKYGEWLRETGDMQKAIKCFEKSTTTNLAQMLVDDPVALKKTMQTTTDKNHLNWWAQYIESTGDMEGALNVYQRAGDWYSQVRLLCFTGQLDKANALAKQSGDRAACYHLARHYENIGRAPEAIQFYTKAKTYGNAVRICKENHLVEELWTVGNLAQGRDKISTAAYFEEHGDFKRAVELYHNSGMLHKAMEMAFASKQPEILQVIASELDPKSDLELVNRCADFFLENGQNYKAVQLLTNTRQFERALKVCAEQGVPITESFAEALTPNKDEIPDEKRVEILWKLGDVLQEQGDYHTATKKFTLAGDKVRAMKCLLKSGDVDKIIFFATMSRQAEVYIMAGNFLQGSNWQRDPKILKSIITFYTKAQSFDLLANFYATTAQVEVNENRSYENALKALQEAIKCVGRVAGAQRTAEHLQSIIVEVKKIIQLEECLERGESETVILGCKNILAAANERPPIRYVDVMILLFQGYMGMGQYQEALGLLREVTRKAPDWSARQMIEKGLIEKLAKECNLSFSDIWSAGDGRYKRQMEGNEPTSDGEEEIEEVVE